jgi:hypothetical protein
MRRLPASLAAVTVLAGCAGGTPVPDQVKWAARSWAARHLHPASLEVTSVIVTRDERRAKVRLTAGSSSYRLRLLRPGADWNVVSIRRG